MPDTLVENNPPSRPAGRRESDTPLEPQQQSSNSRLLMLLATCYWVSLFAGTHVPRLPEVARQASDKTLHFAAFFVLALLLTAARYSRGVIDFNFYRRLLGLLALYGAFDELSQTIVGRDCQLSDWIADMAGASAGLLTFAAVRFWLRRSGWAYRWADGRTKAQRDPAVCMDSDHRAA